MGVMIIRDINNRPYIEKTEDKLIINRITGRRIFKLDAIKAVYLIENSKLKYFWAVLIIYWIFIIVLNLKRANYFEYNIMDGTINLKDSIMGKDYFIDVSEEFNMTYKNKYRGCFYYFNNSKKKIAIEDNVIIPEYYKYEMKKLYEIKGNI